MGESVHTPTKRFITHVSAKNFEGLCNFWNNGDAQGIQSRVVEKRKCVGDFADRVSECVHSEMEKAIARDFQNFSVFFTNLDNGDAIGVQSRVANKKVCVLQFWNKQNASAAQFWAMVRATGAKIMEKLDPPGGVSNCAPGTLIFYFFAHSPNRPQFTQRNSLFFSLKFL